MKPLLRFVVFLLAILLVFEEWLWDSLKSQFKKLGALRFFRWVEGRLRSLGPLGSLAVLAFPALILFPFKLAALWALSHGHTLLGVTVLVIAKLVGTGVAAYLFDIVRDRARELPWFDRLYGWAIERLLNAKAWVHSQPAYLAARAAATTLRAYGATWSRLLGRPGRLSRKLRAAKVLLRAR